MSRIRRSPLWLVCPTQHVSTTRTVIIVCAHIQYTNTYAHLYFFFSLSIFRHTNTIFFFYFLPIHSQSLKYTTQTVWGALFGLLASPTSMTPGPMPSTPSHAAFEHSGSPLANPGQLSDCFPGARPCANAPLSSITKPNHWHCLPALKPEPGESTDTGGHCQGSNGHHSKLQELT